MASEKHFDLPFDDFQSYFGSYVLSQKIVIVSLIGKSNWVEGMKSFGGVDKVFRFRKPEDSSQCDSNGMSQIEGRYVVDEKVLYLNLVGPWNANRLNTVWKQVIQDMKEMGFLHCWNAHTNICARALLFIFTMSHIVIIDHPSHTPDHSTLQLLKLLSYVRPKYQVLQTNLLTRIMDFKDEWFFQGRLCSPRLLFVLACPPDILFEETEEEQIQRIKRIERAIEDRIYMILRKSRIVKYVCNRAFYSIAPNDEFVFVENPPPEEPVDQLEKFLLDVPVKDESDSDEEEMYLHDFSTMKKGHTFQQFLQKHITKAHNEGFYDNMGKYTHVKPFFQRPTLKTWFEAANAILHDPDIGIGNELSVFPAMDSLTSPETHLSGGTSRSQATAPLAMAMYQSSRSQRLNPPFRDRQGPLMKLSRPDKKEDKRKLQIHKRRTKKASPERSSIPSGRQSKT
uniref:Nonsense-mediated mRNA decay factor SMG8 n=3 Tax=Lygus hesperus TaxID=30085 RepID=A0A0A9YQ54_LYGHE